MSRIEWVSAPPKDDEPQPTAAELSAALQGNHGGWARVMTADRRARAEAMVERIESGVWQGDGFQATHRKVGPEFRVYARFVG